MDDHQARLGLIGILLLAFVTGVPSAAAFHPSPLPDGELLSVVVEPFPVPADSPFTVTATFTDAARAESVRLKYCHSEERNATACYPILNMSRDGERFSKETAFAMPASQEIGYNLTIHYRNGSTQYYPSGSHSLGNGYVFFRVGDRPANALPTPWLAAGIAILGASLLQARSLRRAAK